MVYSLGVLDILSGRDVVKREKERAARRISNVHKEVGGDESRNLESHFDRVYRLKGLVSDYTVSGEPSVQTIAASDGALMEECSSEVPQKRVLDWVASSVFDENSFDGNTTEI